MHARTAAALLLNVLKHFTSAYLAAKDIHTLASGFDTETRKTVLSAYFRAVAALQPAPVPTQPASALPTAASSGKASIFALFGGQGTNEVYFDELQNLYIIYTPFVASSLQTVTEDILIPLAEEEDDSTFYTYGLDVVSWLSGTVPRPAVSYLASVPVSFPLIGLTQLVQYLIVYRVANLTPGELRSRIAGATGHSQGIVSAVAIAASATFEEFVDNSRKALKWLFYSGLRGQQAFPVTSVKPFSGDFNPIHINPYFSDFASLPATITYGLWSSAATRRYVETVVAQGHPDRVIAYVFSLDMFMLPTDISSQLRRQLRWNGHSRRRPRSQAPPHRHVRRQHCSRH